jgi:hypothetical protein
MTVDSRPARRTGAIVARGAGALLCLALGACGIVPRYEVPGEAPKARLRNVTYIWGADIFRANLKGDCKEGARGVSALSGMSIQNNGRLNMPDPPGVWKGAMEEVYIDAGQPYYSSSYARHGSVYTGWLTCGPVLVVFDPQPDADYELRLVPDDDGEKKGCRVEVLRLQYQDGLLMRLREPSARPYTCPAP